MRALVFAGPGRAQVQEVPPPFAGALAGHRPAGAGPGPRILIDPRR